MHLIGIYLMGMCLKGVAKSVSDPSDTIISKKGSRIIYHRGVSCIMAALTILTAKAHPMGLRVGLLKPWRYFTGARLS
jgi:hypothetical protein